MLYLSVTLEAYNIQLLEYPRVTVDITETELLLNIETLVDMIRPGKKIVCLQLPNWLSANSKNMNIFADE